MDVRHCILKYYQQTKSSQIQHVSVFFLCHSATVSAFFSSPGLKRTVMRQSEANEANDLKTPNGDLCGLAQHQI